MEKVVMTKETNYPKWLVWSKDGECRTGYRRGTIVCPDPVRTLNTLLNKCQGNKIRDRLEALEALVDKTNKGDALDSTIKKLTSATNISLSGSVSPSKSVPQQIPTPPAIEQHDTSELPTDHTDLWRDMPDFRDTSTEMDDEGDFIEATTSHPSSLTNFPMDLRSPSSFTDNMNGSESMSTYQMPSPALTPNNSLCMQPLETAKPDGLSFRPGSSVSDKPKSQDVSAGTPSQQQPIPYNPFNYGYPFPMVGPMLPINPASFPGKALSLLF